MSLLTGVPNTPSDWTQLLEQHAKTCRKVVVRIAHNKSAFVHAATVFLEPIAEPSLAGDLRFKVTIEEGSSLLPLDIHSTPRLVTEHCWAAATNAGIALSERRDPPYKQIRAEFEGYDGNGESLWDPADIRHRVNLEEAGSPIAEDDDPSLDPQTKKQLSELAWERREHRKTKQELRASLEQERKLTREGSEMLLHVADAIKRVNRMEIEFAQYVGQRIRDDIDESRADARIDFVTEEMVKIIGPKLGGLVEGITIMARNYGQQRDPLEVPQPPAEFELWILSEYSDAYSDYASEKIKLRLLVPGSEEYRQAWFDHLVMLNNTVEGFKFTSSLAGKIKLWAGAAAQSLGIDPHLFSRLTFAEGDPELDHLEQVAAPQKPPGPG